MNNNQIELGNRIALLTNIEIKGIILYYGKIDESLDDIWVGIDWDDDKRGKHDGTYKNKRFFNARTKTSGSFVKSHTLIYGTELIAELQKKYASKVTQINEKRWEFVDFDKIYEKQKNIFELKCIVLNNSTISFVDLLMANNFNNCIELDLSNTFITKWKQLFEILIFFPILKTLHLNNTRMESLSEEHKNFVQKLPKITEIALNNAFVTEKTANILTEIFNNIREIYLANNELTYYSPKGNVENLQKIDLQGNKIYEFSQIDLLKTLPKLEFLNLSSCKLKNIAFSDVTGFNQLNTLYIEENCIFEWNSINELARLINLQKLLIKNSNLNSINGIDIRELIIAKLPNLTELDRCCITEALRRSAELYVLSHLQNSDNFHIKTIERLKKFYKIDEIDYKQNNNQKNVSNINFKRIKLEYKNCQLEKNLSLLLSVHRIVSIASKLFDFDPDNIIKVEIRRNGLFSEQLSRTKDSLLNYFNLDDGDSIAFLTE